MRRKTIAQDGETLTISPLNLAQLEEFGSPLSGDKQEIKIRAFDLVCPTTRVEQWSGISTDELVRPYANLVNPPKAAS